MIRQLCRTLLLSVPFAFSLGAAQIGEHLRIDGFATLGASTVLESGQEFRAYTFQQDGVRTGEVNLVNNSLFGLQGTLQATDALSATVQGLIVNTRDNAYETRADWAYLAYTTDFGLTLRGGKFRLPLFNSSELTYVGYARSWVRPALPFYGTAGYEHYLGGNLIYQFDAGMTQLGLEAGFGIGDETLKTRDNGRRKFHSDDILIAKMTADGDRYHAGVTYFHANTQIQLRTPAGVTATDFTTPAQLVSAETTLYLGDLTVDAGLGYGWVRDALPNELLAYLGASYQVEKWRPYGLFSNKTFDHKPRKNTNTPPQQPLPPDQPLPPEPPGELPPWPGYVSESIFSLGIRYDFAAFTDLKFQVDRALGMRFNPQLLISDDATDREATVFTIAVDMVF